MFSLGKSERQKLGEYLRDKRNSCGISQSEIASILKLKSGQMISNIERGVCSPPLYQILTMATVYKISDKELMLFLMELQESSLRKAINKKQRA